MAGVWRRVLGTRSYCELPSASWAGLDGVGRVPAQRAVWVDGAEVGQQLRRVLAPLITHAQLPGVAPIAATSNAQARSPLSLRKC